MDSYDVAGAPAVVRAIAQKLHRSQYYTVGRVLRELTDEQVEELFNLTARVTTGIDGTPLKILVCLAEMIAQAEGVNIDHADPTRTSNFMVLVSLERQARNGTLVFYRERATLGPDVNLDNLYAA